MGFLIFAPLTFLLLRLSVRWRWRSILLTAIIAGLVADLILDLMVARRS
jgi:hypothetical protein